MPPPHPEAPAGTLPLAGEVGARIGWEIIILPAQAFVSHEECSVLRHVFGSSLAEVVLQQCEREMC